MGYEKINPDDLPDAPSPTTHKKEIDEAVGATTFGCNLYEAEPGQQLSMGYHSHPAHEELLYVLEGRLRFETADGEYEVGAGEAFFVPMKSGQKGYAVGNVPARVLAIGAPKAEDHAVLEEPCDACGETTDREFELTSDGDGRTVVLYCADCGAESERFGSGS